FGDVFGAYGGGEKRVVLPKPVYPQLDAKGQPVRVDEGGSSATVPDKGPFDFHLQTVVAKLAPLSKPPDRPAPGGVRGVNQGRGGGGKARLVVVGVGLDPATGEEVERPAPRAEVETVGPLGAKKGETVNEVVTLPGKCPKSAVVEALVEPRGSRRTFG